ncbi:MAG: hypothetical protein FD189_854 [Elusimicrobia bacterium]|nr:MAG: hypothetical protein FD154_933 [Elusimicrobiota bacterium]KAF0156714.1 MAG: hypothetical protein FD189_854 [Elusimicrobiota bacterium]
MLWDKDKSARLKKERGVSFEEIAQAELVAVLEHASRRNQRLLLFRHEGYIWVVPYVYRQGGIFLKTLFPSRKYTKKFMKG